MEEKAVSHTQIVSERNRQRARALKKTLDTECQTRHCNIARALERSACVLSSARVQNSRVSESPTKERDTVADPPNPFIRRIPTRLDQRHLDHDASHAVRNEQHRPLLILLSSQCVEVFQECIGQLAKSRPFDHVGVTICSIGLPPDALPHQG